MLDEYQSDRESALAVLEEAIAYHGSDVILSRALAKVYFRHDEHGRPSVSYAESLMSLVVTMRWSVRSPSEKRPLALLNAANCCKREMVSRSK